MRLAFVSLTTGSLGVILWTTLVSWTETDRISFNPLPFPAHDISGISYDGSSLLITREGHQTIFEVEPDTGRIKRRFHFPPLKTAGSAYDGETLWQLAYEEKKIYQVDLRDGRILRSFPSPGKGMCCGMTYDGKYLWVANFGDEKLYQIDQNDGGRVVRSVDSDFEVTGLAWDGRFLWNGILVGTETHDEVTPYTGFVQQRNIEMEKTFTVLPISGVGPGTSNWTAGSGKANVFWWFDGFHKQILRVELHQGSFMLRSGLALALVLALISLGLALRLVL